MRAARVVGLNVPKPNTDTGTPARVSLMTASAKALTAASACLRSRPARVATASISSVLFTATSWRFGKDHCNQRGFLAPCQVFPMNWKVFRLSGARKPAWMGVSQARRPRFPTGLRLGHDCSTQLRFAGEGHVEDLFDIAGEVELHLGADALGNVVQVWLVARREHHLAHARLVSGEHFSL